MREMRSLILAFTCLLLAAGGVAAQKQAEPPAPAGLFIETIDVTVVNVEVYVTDKNGERVSGLTRDDFELFEDKRPVAISNFAAIEDRRPRVADSVPATPATPGRPAAAAKAAATLSGEASLPEDQRLHLVVYIDNANIEPLHRNRLYRYLDSFLRRNLTEEDRAALYTYEKALHLRQPFTSGSDDLLKALRETEGLSGLGVTREKERQTLLRDIERARSRSEIEGRLRMYAESTFNDLRFTIDALNEMIDGLAGLPGRKAVLYVSDGLPMRPAEDLYSALGDQFNDPSAITDTLSWDVSSSIEALAQRANANRVTFYTIEAAGLRAYSAIGAADSGSSKSFIGVDQIRRQNWSSTLKSMAEETGGLAITGTSNFAPALMKVGSDFDIFYSLGYHASHGGDGRYHEIKVRTKRKGLTVRHRTGYRAKTPSRWMSDRTRAALIYDQNSNPLELDLLVEPASKHEDRHYIVPLVVRIPVRNVTLIPDDELWVVEIPSSEVQGAQDMWYAHEVSLQMRQGATLISVGVRDDIGARSSFVTRQFSIGDYQAP
jgi:VWFA-related protein